MKKKIYLSLLASSVLISSLNAADDLRDVIVTAKTQKSALDTAGSFSVITEKDIKKTGASSIKEVLEGVVGLNMGVNDASMGGRQNISIRGTNSKDTLILVDGEKISGSDAQIGHSDFQYNWIPLNAIAKIEIIRGPMSAMYGSSAIGGIVNIITKKPGEETQGDITLETGYASREGGKNLDFSISGGGKVNDKFSIIGYANSKTMEPENVDGITEVEGKKVKNLMLKAWYDIDQTQQITAFVISGREKRKTHEFNEQYDIKKAHYSIGYKKDFDDINLNVKYYSNASDTHTQVKKFKFTHEMHEDTFNAELKIASFDNNFILLGGEYKEEKYRKKYPDPADDATKGFEDSIKYTSVYLQDEIEIGSNTILTLGARYDKHEKFGGELSPKANLVYKLSDNSRLKAGYGHGFSAPTLTQNSDDYSVAIPVEFKNFGGAPSLFRKFHGNDDLKPEKSDTYELGYDYEKDKLAFKATYFHTELTDLIDDLYTEETSNGSWFMPMTYKHYRYSNIGKARIDGVELEFTQNEIFDMIDFNLNYTFLDTENKDTKEELFNRPAHTANLKLSVDLPWEIGSDFRVNYVGEQTAADGETMDAYTTLGLQFSKEYIEDLTLRAGVENLSNVKSIGDGNNIIYIRGRYVYAKLNYAF